MTVTITHARAANLPCQFWTFDALAPDVPDVSLPGALAVTTRVARDSPLAGRKIGMTLTVTLLPIPGMTPRCEPTNRLVNYAAASLTGDALRHLKL